MNPCVTCGREIRLRAMRVSVNRKRGCANWLAPQNGPNCICLDDYAVTKWRSDKSRPTVTDKMIAEWNSKNPTERSAAQ